MWDWYRLINKNDFDNTNLVSQELTLVLEGIGQKTFMLTHGRLFSITVDDTMLAAGMNGKNPFIFNNRALYIDLDNVVWYGVPAA